MGKIKDLLVILGDCPFFAALKPLGKRHAQAVIVILLPSSGRESQSFGGRAGGQNGLTPFLVDSWIFSCLDLFVPASPSSTLSPRGRKDLEKI